MRGRELFAGTPAVHLGRVEVGHAEVMAVRIAVIDSVSSVGP